MKEHYVTYEQAVKLKEFGFDEPCYNFWSLEPDGNPLIITSTLCNIRSSDLKGRDVAAPFLWQAQKWLREHYGIHVSANPHLDYSEDADGRICDKWHFWAFDLINVESEVIMDDSDDMYESYEQALSAGIDKALELLTNKLNRE